MSLWLTGNGEVREHRYPLLRLPGPASTGFLQAIAVYGLLPRPGFFVSRERYASL